MRVPLGPQDFKDVLRTLEQTTKRMAVTLITIVHPVNGLRVIAIVPSVEE
jgi:hypothetical protein